MSGNHECESGMSLCVGAPSEVEPTCSPMLARAQHRENVRSPVESPAPGEPFVRQLPPCFDGNCTASRLRPFLRRRLSTARPQRVRIRARNPCFLVRRRLRGRYVGFIHLPTYKGRKASCARSAWSRLTFPHWGGNIGRPFKTTHPSTTFADGVFCQRRLGTSSRSCTA